MVKRLKNKAAKSTVISNFEDFFAGYLRAVGTRESELETRVEHIESDIDENQDEIDGHQSNIENLEDSIATLRREKEKVSTELEDLKEHGEEKAKEQKDTVKKQFDKLVEHVGIETIKYDGQLDIKTKLLFANVPEDEEQAGANEDGEEIDATRICLGAFRVRINPTMNHVAIDNELFEGHWGFGFGRNVCLGEYQADFTERCTRGDWYGAFDLIYHYIQSYEDRGAYIHPWSWRESYHNLNNHRIGDGIKPGDRVLYVGSSYDGNNLYGFQGKILKENGPDIWVIEFLHPLPPNRQNGNNDWCVPKGGGYIIKMLDGEFEGVPILENSQMSLILTRSRTNNPRAEAMEKIDSLPNLSSLEDAMKIINSYQ